MYMYISTCTPTTHSLPWHCCQISGEYWDIFPNWTAILSLRIHTNRMSVISDESRPPEASRTASWSVLVTSSFDKAFLPKILFKEEIYFRFPGWLVCKPCRHLTATAIKFTYLSSICKQRWRSLSWIPPPPAEGQWSQAVICLMLKQLHHLITNEFQMACVCQCILSKSTP